MARNSVCKKSFVIGDDEAFCRWEFSDGKEVTFYVHEMSEAMQVRAMVHGILQKGGDSYSGIGTPTEARAALEATLAAIGEDDWNRRPDVAGILAEALHRVTGQPMGDVRAKLAEMDDKKKASLKKHPKIKLAIAQISLEKLKFIHDDVEDVVDF